MATIKVTYGSTVRRLTIPSTITWSEMENQFHNLFNIPQEIPISVSYTDEDDDVITLSSDLELQEALSNNNNTNTIKFVLTTSNVNNNNNNNNRERSIDTITDEVTSSLINGVSAIHIEESNNNKHVTITDEVDEQQQQETPGENSRNVSESTNVQENNENQESNSDDEPEIIVIITRNPWSSRRRARFGGCNPYHFHHSNPYHGFGGRSHHGFHFGQGYNTDGGCSRSRGYGCGGRNYRRHQSENLSEKLNTLHSMGFFDENLEDLLKIYNGNLEFVIEFLLQNNFHQNNNEQQNDNQQNNNQQNNSQIDREEILRKENSQPMEVEEETRPYDL